MSLAVADAAQPGVLPLGQQLGDWERSFGRQWKWDVAVMAAVVFLFGAIRPLADPDLPMHLSIGEWIVRHRGVPFVEPFAWTRAGAPYYAYSWLQQVAYYVTLQAFGPWGLRALQGVLVLCSGIAVVALAHAARWRPGQAVIVAALNLIVGAFFVGFLRPQSVLLITIPVIWAGVYHIARGDRVLPAAAIIFLASAVTANSHLFFPLTLAPTALFWVHPPRRSRDWMVGALAVLLGWLASPYALHWPEIFAHNFGANLLTRPPSVVTELQPGFVSMLYPTLSPMVIIVAVMLALPWALMRAGLPSRQLLVTSLYWGAGLVLFGYASRLFLAWWLLCLPAIGAAIVALTRGSQEGAPRLRFRVLGLVACTVIIATQLVKTRELRAMEGNTERRTLPTYAVAPAERLASTLVRAGGSNHPGRMMSTFVYGSYLTWRLPRLSQSIDSRGLFPDSVTAVEAIMFGSDRKIPLGPWRSSDLVLVPLNYRVAGVLDTAAGWQRLDTAPGAPTASDSVGLWVRRDWWAGRAADSASAR